MALWARIGNTGAEVMVALGAAVNISPEGLATERATAVEACALQRQSPANCETSQQSAGFEIE